MVARETAEGRHCHAAHGREYVVFFRANPPPPKSTCVGLDLAMAAPSSFTPKGVAASSWLPYSRARHVFGFAFAFGRSAFQPSQHIERAPAFAEAFAKTMRSTIAGDTSPRSSAVGRRLLSAPDKRPD